MSNSKIKLRDVPLDKFMTNFSHYLTGRKPLPVLSKHQDELGLQASCVNCLHFVEVGFKNPTNGAVVPPETCKKFNARPPARIIALSCEAWEDLDDIPF